MKNNHYFKRYLKLINYLDSQEWHEHEYCEKHHILPKCFGGDRSKNNLIKIPYRWHIICHYLLHKAFPEDSSLAAAYFLVTKSRGVKISTRHLLISRLAAIRANKERHKDPKFKERHSKAIKESFKDGKRAAEVSTRMKSLWKDPAYRKKVAAALDNPDRLKTLSLKCKKQNSDPAIHTLQRKGQIKKLSLRYRIVYEFVNKETGHAFCGVPSAAKVFFRPHKLVNGLCRTYKGYKCLCLINQPTDLENYY